jgi:hypothetical protein
MSRRETSLNTFLGAFLILALALYVAFYMGAAWLGIQGLEFAARHFLPRAVSPKAGSILAFFIFFAVTWLVAAVKHLRSQRWRSAFLRLAVIPAMLSIWFADARSLLGLGGAFGMFILLAILGGATASEATRFDFYAYASLVCAVVAVNTGLLGWGWLARIVSDCALAGVLAWLALEVRQRLTGRENVATQPPFSAPRA